MEIMSSYNNGSESVKMEKWEYSTESQSHYRVIRKGKSGTHSENFNLTDQGLMMAEKLFYKILKQIKN